MRYVYFTKLLQGLDLAGLVAFCKETGLEGFDLAVRHGYPVTPENALTALPKAAAAFKEAGLDQALPCRRSAMGAGIPRACRHRHLSARRETEPRRCCVAAP